MRVSERTDSRTRKGLLRDSFGRCVESMVLPLELLQQFNTSDFPDQQEYEADTVSLEAGLLVHPLLPSEKADTVSQWLRQIIASNIENFQGIILLGVPAAKILVEDISNEYHHKRREETDVARSRVDTYIQSSLRTAFVQRMELADSGRLSSKNQNTSTPVLSILSKGIGEVARKEKSRSVQY
ncbi:unnamed protein product [Musa acuminata subsp. malaccensis]|uniref:(wild Malaysian banana) hypothetical protein n=1 Tax=Musa acuminata subsp. malaccensis TaxID=214687 RepID=A0A804KGG4_MUSAM|nr:unnamed protein product [Musa acuminata subsp. malaccensis]